MPCKFVHLSSLHLGSVMWFPLVIGMLSNIAQAEAGITLRDCSMSLSRCTCWDYSVNKPETACWRIWSHVERTELPDGRESTVRHVREAFWEQQAPDRPAQAWSHIGLNKCSRTEVMLQSLNVSPASTWTIFGNIPWPKEVTSLNPEWVGPFETSKSSFCLTFTATVSLFYSARVGGGSSVGEPNTWVPCGNWCIYRETI